MLSSWRFKPNLIDYQSNAKVRDLKENARTIQKLK